MPNLTNVEPDFLCTDVLTSTIKPTIQEKELSWPEDRYVVGWNPWIGYGKGGEFESHLILLHEIPGPNGTPPIDVQLFARGPHKENQSVMYDEAKSSDFFRANEGRLVLVGEKVKIQFLISNTAPGQQAQGQANARIFSVRRN
jgi:hypothetical protein